MSFEHQYLDAALKVVGASCHVARGVQRDLERVREVTKDDRSPVTVADFAVQAVVAMALAEAAPNVPIVGEEKADLLRQDEQNAVRSAVVEAVRTVRPDVSEDDVLAAIDGCDHDASGETYWALDPIDGTKGFLRGQQYAIALGLISGGQVVMGVMGCANLPLDQTAPVDRADAHGTIYAATLGGGTWSVDPKQLDRASADQVMKAAATGGGNAIRVCESVEKAHSKQSDTERILEHLDAEADPVRLDSQCKYAVVARGQADAYLRLPTKKGYVEKIWDHAAGSLVATEAGATVTDITGAPLDFTRGQRLEGNRGIVCAASDLHPKLIDAIATLEIGVAV